MTAPAVDPMDLEPIAARAWPAAEESRIGSWRLYASSGFSGRINACWPLGDPGLPLAEAVARAEAWYAEKRLSPRFKIVESMPGTLTDYLASRGFRPGGETLTMVAPIAAAAAPPDIRLSGDVDARFAKVFASAGGAGPGDTRERLEALARVPAPRAFALVLVDGQPAAIGACAIDDRWVGIFVMRTGESWRRRGLARRVLSALTAHAAASGARRAWLQVEADNLGALALYRAAGFDEAYRYHYWVKPALTAPDVSNPPMPRPPAPRRG